MTITFHDRNLIGEGTYGKVYKIPIPRTENFLAVKRVASEKDYGVPFTTIREIKILKHLRHKNIVTLINVEKNLEDTVMVFEYMAFDLCALIATKFVFTKRHLGSISNQLLNAVNHIHKNNYVHRDIKSSNILLNHAGVLKLADFGLTRPKEALMTNKVCTLWYRAPELLLGTDAYGPEIDIWSCGCVIAEIATGSVVFQKNDDISQIKTILKSLGPPKTEYKWSYLFDMQKYAKCEEEKRKFLRNLSSNLDENMFYLVLNMLNMNSSLRITAEQALSQDFMNKYDNVCEPIKTKDVHEYTVSAKR